MISKRDFAEAGLFQLLEDYFMFRRKWYFGSKESLKYLQEHDKETYQLYEIALRQDATIDQIEELAQKVISFFKTENQNSF
jgi:hypothetical protein